MLCYKHFNDREEWLKGRETFKGIGASEAAAVVGISPWITATELWQLKTGMKQEKRNDLDDNEYIRYGTEAEEHIRMLFMLKHEEYKLNYRPYDFLYQKERPWLRCTLDGELEAENGEKGILEVKTHFVRSKNDLNAWNGMVPDHYYCQVCHQLLATGFSFAYLTAELIFQSGESNLRTYYFTRHDASDDMRWLLEQEEAFWKSVKDGNSPSVNLVI